MQMSPTRQRRLSSLDGLRGVAAVGVAVLHVWFYTDDPRPLSSVGDSLLQALRLGVPLFFVLSGLLLYLPWLGDRPPNIKAYAIRRAARILPAYWLALAGSALIIAATHVKGLPTAAEAAAVAGLVQTWWPAAADELNGPAWTLAIEASFYLVLPLLGLATVRWLHTARRQLAGCALLVVVSLAANALVSAFGPHAWHRTFPAMLYTFALGMAAAVPLARGVRPSALMRLGLIAIGTTLVVVDAFAHEPLRIPGYLTWGDLPAAAGFAAIVVAVAASDHSPVLSAAPVRWIGERSYGLYLWHAPVIFLLAGTGLLPGSTPVAAVVVIGMALVIAALSWRFVEQPILNRARSLPVGRRTPRTHARRSGSTRPSGIASTHPRAALARHGS